MHGGMLVASTRLVARPLLTSERNLTSECPQKLLPATERRGAADPVSPAGRSCSILEAAANRRASNVNYSRPFLAETQRPAALHSRQPAVVSRRVLLFGRPPSAGVMSLDAWQCKGSTEGALGRGTVGDRTTRSTAVPTPKAAQRAGQHANCSGSGERTGDWARDSALLDGGAGTLRRAVNSEDGEEAQHLADGERRDNVSLAPANSQSLLG